MNFLYTDEQTGEIKITHEAMVLQSVIDLYGSDKIAGGEKPFFKKAIKYIYHQYYNEHPLFKNLSYKERRQRNLELYFGGFKGPFEELERNNRIKEVIKDYLYYQRVFSEKKYMAILDKIDELSEHLEHIPLKIKKKVDKTIEVDVPDGEGNMLKRDIPIKTEIVIDNSKEYYNAIQMISDILDLEEKIRHKMIKEKADKELNPKTMIDDDKFNELK